MIFKKLGSVLHVPSLPTARVEAPFAKTPVAKAVVDAFANQTTLASTAPSVAAVAALDSVGPAVAQSLLQKVAERANLEGSGVEVYGRGDAELIRRRKWVGLLDQQKYVSLDETFKDAAWLKEDRRVNAMLEQRDTPQVGLGDAEWEALKVETTRALEATRLPATEAPIRAAVEQLKASNASAADVLKALTAAQEHVAQTPKASAAAKTLQTVVDAFLWREVNDAIVKARDANTEAATAAAQQLGDGSKRFVEADPQALSTMVLSVMNEDAKLRPTRPQAMVDLLLQFRAPEDTTGAKRRLFAGGEGIQAVSELRNNARSVTARLGDPVAEREYALMRAVTLANPRLSTNAVLEARHVVSKLRRLSWELVYGPKSAPKGHDTAPYAAIHHNFSANTPAVIDAFIRHSVFDGEPEHFMAFVDAMNRAGGQGASDSAKVVAPLVDLPEYEAFNAFRRAPAMQKQSLRAQLEGFLASRVKGALDSKSADDASLSAVERENLQNGGVESVKGEYAEKLNLCAQLYRAVCKSMPDAGSLSDALFDVRDARPQVAAVISALSQGQSGVGLLEKLVDARAALRTEFDTHPEGFRRLAIWKLDGQLEQLISGQLGKQVDAASTTATERRRDAQAMRAALESLKLSSFQHLNAAPSAEATAAVDHAIAQLKGIANDDWNQAWSDQQYRQAMGSAQTVVRDAVDAFKRYVGPRSADVEAGRLQPNPAFFDDFVKESPLHYATALGQRARGAGLVSEVTATSIRNPEGVTALNPLGPVVFDRLLYVPTMDALRELNPGANDLAIVPEIDEKKMVRAGGVWSVFPNGQAHAVVYGEGVGMAIVSGGDFDSLMKFSNTMRDASGAAKKVYYDDSEGLTLMPYDEALAQGLAKVGDDERLKSGTNRRIEYKKWNEQTQSWDTEGRHSVTVHPSRRTNDVVIYGPAETIRGYGRRAMSFKELASLGTDGRGLGGEKNTVLAIMSQHPELKDAIPDGGLIPTPRAYMILESAGMRDDWFAPFDHDPLVGRIDDENFLSSKFYTDPAYRKQTRERLFAMTQQRVRQALLTPDGRPTAAGRALLDEFKFPSDIIRSSYTAEDRPYKSGAGQYDSFPNSFEDRKKLEAVADGLASMWDEVPIENNVKDQYNLRHIQPSLTVMKQVDAVFSGVSQSRDNETGYRRTMSYQAVPGFGGGVEKTTQSEQGKVTKGGRSIARLAAEQDTSLLTEAHATELRRLVLTIERLFHEVIEPGQAHAVDVEWAFDRNENRIKIVQARTLST